MRNAYVLHVVALMPVPVRYKTFTDLFRLLRNLETFTDLYKTFTELDIPMTATTAVFSRNHCYAHITQRASSELYT